MSLGVSCLCQSNIGVQSRGVTTQGMHFRSGRFVASWYSRTLNTNIILGLHDWTTVLCKAWSVRLDVVFTVLIIAFQCIIQNENRHQMLKEKCYRCREKSIKVLGAPHPQSIVKVAVTVSL